VVDRPRVEVTQEVLQFLTDYIDTVPHLEALLLLWENPDTTWSEAEIAARIYVRPETAGEILRGFARRGFVRAQEAAAFDMRVNGTRAAPWPMWRMPTERT